MILDNITKYEPIIKNRISPKHTCIGIVFGIDKFLVPETVTRLLDSGFDRVINIVQNSESSVDDSRVINLLGEVRARTDVFDILNALMPLLKDKWIYWGYNAEFLYFPYCESRSIKDFTTFLSEERRLNCFSMVVDLYPKNVLNAPDGYDLEEACFDSHTYFTTPPTNIPDFIDPTEIPRIHKIQGGLRWRYNEYFDTEPYNLSRIPLYFVTPDLHFNKDGWARRAEFHTYHNPHHHSPTGAILSFRNTIALRYNPISRDEIKHFSWSGSEAFKWSSVQLLNHGIIEPGQWF